MTEKRPYAIEDFFGALLLGVGLALLGLFNFKSEEPLIEAGLRAQSATIVETTVHGLKVEVEGRHLRLTGLADSEAEKTRVLNALRDLEGRGRIDTEVTVLEAMDPFVLSVTLKDDATYAFSGAVPTQALRDTWRETYGDAVDALTLASGMPDADWPDVAHAGLRALSELERATLTLDGAVITLAGTALTPNEVERAILLVSDLPEAYDFKSDLEVLDDGTPLRLSAGRVEGALSGITGKLPRDISDTLASEEVVVSPLALPVANWDVAITQGIDALNALHNGHLSVIGTSLTLSGEARSQQAYETALERLNTMPKGISVSHNLTLTDTGEPFALSLLKSEVGILATGKVPTSLSPRVLSALSMSPLEAPDLTIARVSPGQDWWSAASIGTQAMQYVDEGSMAFDGTRLTLKVTLQNPDRETRMRALLAELPPVVETEIDVVLIDDGTPLRMTLDFDGQTAVVTGKLPRRLGLDQLSAPLGVPVLSETVLRTDRPAPLRWNTTAQALATMLSQFQEGTATLQGTTVSLSGVVRSPQIEAQVSEMLADLPATYSHSLEVTFRDDTRPFAFDLRFDGTAAQLSGIVPQDLGPTSQQAILGHPVTPMSVEFAERTADAEWWAAARLAVKALGRLDQGALRMDAHQIHLTGQAPDQPTLDEIEATFGTLISAFKVSLDIN